MTDKEMKQKWEQELEEIKAAYPKLQAVINEFGLNNTGTPSHSAMDIMLQSLRDRTLDLNERLTGQRS